MMVKLPRKNAVSVIEAQIVSASKGAESTQTTIRDLAKELAKLDPDM